MLKIDSHGSRGAADTLAVLAIVVLSAVVVFAPTGSLAPGELDGGDYRTRGFGDYEVHDLKLVYHGRTRFMNRPCVVRSDAVYALIPEYQEIQARGFPSTKPKYHFLMREASQKFTRAVGAMARRYRHDCVVEAGGIRIVDPGAQAPPDRTKETIQALSR